MAKNRPVRTCTIKHMPNSEPKFHQAEMLDGVGRSMNELFTIFSTGWVFRRLCVIGFCS